MRLPALLALLLLTTFPASAQQYLPFEAGHLLVAGRAGFERSSGDIFEQGAAEERRIQVDARVQYFWLQGLALGADVMLERSDREPFGATTYGVGPSASYFVGDSASQAIPFASISGLFIGHLVNDETETLRYFGGGVHASGGLAYRLGDHVAATVEALFAFELAAPEEASSSYESRTGLGLRLGLMAFI